MKAGKIARVTQVTSNGVVEARRSTGMSQAEFASALHPEMFPERFLHEVPSFG